MRIVYADNAATTSVSRTALEAMLPYFTEHYGNPSTIYSVGREARRALDTAREKVAKALGTEAKEIYFTGGGTEADNWAIRGTAELRQKKGKHIITTAIEHHAVLHTCKDLEKHGYEVTYLPVDEYGRVTADQLRGAIREDTILVSIMAANNEIGTILPIKELCAIAHEKGVLFHTDAVQAVGHIPLDVKELDVDMLSVSAHKFRGPKGIGALYVRRGLSLPPLLTGGGQESGRRSGTENVAGACGMAAALEESVEHMDENVKKVSAMRDRLIEGLLKIPYSRLTGDPVNRLPGTASFVFEFIEGESMILSLDAAGICASSGSACSSGSLDPSHVLTAIGLPHEVAHGSLRLSINECNTEEDIDYILQTLPPIIQRLRDMSPLWEDYIKKFKA
ncbi:MAG TPA: cysteine desulfurase NifS [Clostridiales bacterium]|jgi:cysteine desulfurase|nr:cysteine desulfurase NifS [Clostridiales bacterium]